MLLSEVLKGKSPIQIQWFQKGPQKLIGEFDVGEDTFGIVLTSFQTKNDPLIKQSLSEDYSILLCSFGVKIGEWKYSHQLRNNSPFPASVLNTVITAIQQNLKPGQLLCFVAKRSSSMPNGSDKPSTDDIKNFERRRAFYNLMVSKYQRQGWHAHTVKFDGGSVGYFLYNRPINPEDIKNIIQSLNHKVDKR